MGFLDGLVTPIYWSMDVLTEEDSYKITARTKPLSNKLIKSIEEQAKIKVETIPMNTIFKVELEWMSKEQIKTIDLLLTRKIKPPFKYLTRELKELNIFKSNKGVQLGVVFEGTREL